MKKSLPIGINEFRELIEHDAYYVDKTLFIEAWLSNLSKVTLITRPRRFGKTLNMTMLREFLDITKDSRELFEGLAIMNTSFVTVMNQWPVIYLSFKDCKGSYRNAMTHLYTNLYDMLRSIQDLKVQDNRLQRVLTILETMDFEQCALVSGAISFGSQLLYQHYGKKVMIILDEYDTPMTSAYERGYYEQVRDLYKSLYGSALKDNPYLERAMVSGINRIAKENIFSDLNNIDVYSVLDWQYSQYFGLTSEETETLLIYYGLTLSQEVCAMYDGYLIGNQEIYNPWSVINYANRKALNTYWANTATNELLGKAIAESSRITQETFEQLIEGNTVRVPIDLQVSFFEMQKPSTLWGLFLNSGYITVVKDPQPGGFRTPVRIPNAEVIASFRGIVSRYGGFEGDTLDDLFDALLCKDISGFTRYYESIVLENSSFYDAKEHTYHMLFLGMCVYLNQHYKIYSNKEFGYGRPDIRLEAKKLSLFHVILEFKYGEDVEKLAREAIAQIHEKKYYAGLTGEVLLLGIAHNKKACFIADETIVL